jgi:tetratricopeptide (TPR) repeat protein
VQGQVPEAGVSLQEALEFARRTTPAALPDRLSFMALKHAALQVWFGMESEHAALSRQMIQWAADQPRFAPKGRAARMLNLRPVNDPQLQNSALELARIALEAAPTNALLVWYRLNLGVAQFRLGHYPEAEEALLASEQEGLATWHPTARTCASKFYRAMILHRQGKEARARQLFTEAEAAMQPLPAVVHYALTEGADCDELMLWLAFKEARALLYPPSK